MCSSIKRTASLLVALVVAVVTIIGSAVPAFAATGSSKITIQPNGQVLEPDDRFAAYQIFAGTKAKGNDHQLDNITWGDGIDSEQFMNALKSEADIKLGEQPFGTVFSEAYNQYQGTYSGELTEAEFVAAWLGQHRNSPEYADAFARIAAKHVKPDKKTSSKVVGDHWEIQNIADGYYLVIDEYTSEDNLSPEEHSDGSVSSYILEVIGEAEADLKASVPTVEKKVEGQDGYLAATEEEVTFTLTGTVAENISEYDKYVYEFVDALSKGFADIDQSSIEVAVGIKTRQGFWNSEHKFTKDDDYTVEILEGDATHKNEGGKTLHIKFEDLKSKILEAWADMTHDLQTGQTDDKPWLIAPDLGNPIIANSVYIRVTYKAKLDSDAVIGSAGNANDVTLSYSNNPYDEGTGETVPDEVKTYSLGLDVHKVDETGEPITEAKFKLRKKDGDNVYAKANRVDGTNTDCPDEKYYEIQSFDQAVGNATEMQVEEDGKLHIHGLEIGEYILEETVTRDGYELMRPIEIKIEASAEGGDDNGDGVVDETGELSGSIKINQETLSDKRQDVSVETESFANHEAGIKIINYPAPILPSTGGIGRTIVIAVGCGVLIVGGAAVLITLRKKKKDNKA